MKTARHVPVLLVVTGLTGCAMWSARYTPIRTYTLDVQPAVQPASASLGPVLGVRRFSSAGRYQYRMVYRLSDVEAGVYEYDRWIELPDEMVTQAFITTLRAARLFDRVEPEDALRLPPIVLHGDLLRFDEVIDPNGRYAECVVRLRLVNADRNVILWAETISATAPVDKPTGADVARAMNQAVAAAAEKSVVALAGADLVLDATF